MLEPRTDDAEPDLPFDRYRSNVHSQNGEDGVIGEILRRLQIEDSPRNWCVEFGAWDGIFLSNTFALVERGWNAVYIEGDDNRYKDLLHTAEKFPTITPVNALVARSSCAETSLDALLGNTKIPSDFSLLSIDIDSFDCDVWESLRHYSPQIVVIEINSSVPPGVIWRHSVKTPGNTFTATVNVGRKKGYTLVCHTGNLIFVRNDRIAELEVEQRYLDYPELLFLFDNPWLPDDLFRLKDKSMLRFLPKRLQPFVRRIYAHLGRSRLG